MPLFDRPIAPVSLVGVVGSREGVIPKDGLQLNAEPTLLKLRVYHYD